MLEQWELAPEVNNSSTMPAIEMNEAMDEVERLHAAFCVQDAGATKSDELAMSTLEMEDTAVRHNSTTGCTLSDLTPHNEFLTTTLSAD